MTDVVFTSPAGRQPRAPAAAAFAPHLRFVCTYGAFALSVAFSLAVVLGLIA